MALDDRRHPEAERLAEYVDGVLAAADRAEIERHLADCADCRAVVADTMDLVLAESGDATKVETPRARVIPFRSRRWMTSVAIGLAAAAALVIAVRVARPEWASGLFGRRSDRPELQELIAAVANEPTRPVEGRLTGGFKYAPPPSPTRGPGGREASPDVRIAAAKIEKLAEDKDTPENLVAAGVARLSLGDRERAVALLEEAIQRQPNSGLNQSDLAAAYLARASWDGFAEDWPKALAAAERAVALSPLRPEPYFNRALALEGLHLDEQAIDAWKSYRNMESASGWEKEADEHLRRLTRRPSATPVTSPSADNQSLREYIEDDLLARWGQATTEPDLPEATLAVSSFHPPRT